LLRVGLTEGIDMCDLFDTALRIISVLYILPIIYGIYEGIRWLRFFIIIKEYEDSIVTKYLNDRLYYHPWVVYIAVGPFFVGWFWPITVPIILIGGIILGIMYGGRYIYEKRVEK